MDSEPTELRELRSTLQKQGASWQVAANEIFLLSDEEKRRRLGANPPGGEAELRAREQQAQANLAALQSQGARGFGAPASVDWRNNGGRNFVTPIKNQASCGSCVAFGSTATVESKYRIQSGDANYPIDLSEAMLFYCIARDQGRNCDNGWWVPPALDGYKNTGVCDEACYPYTAGDQACGRCADWAGRVVKIGSWHEITNIADMKNWLASGGPLAACFTVYNDFFGYSGGVYTHVSGGVAGGHCVCCVGYDDAQGCWIMKNSWGAGWGESGFFRIAYGQCGIDSTMWAVDAIATGIWQNNKNIIGLWTIDQDRNAWVYVNGIGWKKIAPDNDVIFYNLLAQCIAAKAGNRPVNFYEEQGVIKQVYVW